MRDHLCESWIFWKIWFFRGRSLSLQEWL